MRIIVLSILSMTIFFACQPSSEKIFEGDDPRIEITEDTLFFDTIFTERKSISRRFLIKNIESRAIIFQNISLLGLNTSNNPFELIINGKTTNSLSDLTLLGKDSLLVIAKITIEDEGSDTPFLVQDKISIKAKSTSLEVDLIAWGQNANYITDEKIACNTVWDDSKPYVIVPSLITLEEGCTLTIEKGVNVHFPYDGELAISGVLQVNGTTDEKVIFEGNRLEDDYKELTAQWKGLVFKEKSEGNISHTIFRNATDAIEASADQLSEAPILSFSKVKIHNISNSGISMKNTHLRLSNSIITHCGEHLVSSTSGGSFISTYNTLANRSSTSPFSETSTAIDINAIDNTFELSLTNTIIFGSKEEEITFPFESTLATFTATNNSIKTSSEEFDNTNIISEDPLFLDISNEDFSLKTGSSCIGKAKSTAISDDYFDKVRDLLSPNIGAIETISTE